MFTHMSKNQFVLGAVAALVLGAGLVNTASASTLTVSCSVSPTSPAMNQQVTWTATASGGSAVGPSEWGLYGFGSGPWPASYDGTPACPSISPTPSVSESPTDFGPTGGRGSVCSSVGTKCINNPWGCQHGGPGNCEGQLFECYPGIPLSPTYSYSWSSDTGSLSGATASIVKTYTTAGTKDATVTATVNGALNAWEDAQITVTPGKEGIPSCSSLGVSQGQTCSNSAIGHECYQNYSPAGCTAPWGTTGQCEDAGLICISGAGGGPAAGSQPASASCSVTIPVPSYPNLTASSITETTAVANVAQTYSATVTNTSTTTGTGAAFKDLFQVAYTYDSPSDTATGVEDIGTYSNAALAASGTATATSPGYATSTPTFYVRACADKSSANDQYGVIDEGPDHQGEGNNCGGWTAVTIGGTCADPTDLSCICLVDPHNVECVSYCASNPTEKSCICLVDPKNVLCTSTCETNPASSICDYCTTHSSDTRCDTCATHPTDPSCIIGPTPTTLSASLFAVPDSITYGDSSELEYTCTKATTASIDNNVGTVSAADTGGTVPVSPSESTTYTLTCANADASAHADAYVTVDVTAPVLSLKALPVLVRSGGSTTIAWSGGAGSCTVSGPGLSSTAHSGTTSPEITIKTESTYTFSCIAGDFNPVVTTIVKVVPSFKEF